MRPDTLVLPLSLQVPILGVLAMVGTWLLLQGMARSLPRSSLARRLLLRARLSLAGSLLLGTLLWWLGSALSPQGLSVPTGHELRELMVSIALVWTLWRWKTPLVQSSASLASRLFPAVDSKARTFVVDVTDKVLGLLALLLVLLSALRLMGVPANVLLTTGGLGAAALGFGARTIVENALSGLGLYLNRPFVVGDAIRLPDQNLQGDVEAIGWFYTRLRDPERQPLHIPNGLFTTRPVVNLSGADRRRLQIDLELRGLEAEAAAALCRAMEAAMAGESGIDGQQALGMKLVGVSAVGGLRARLWCHASSGEAPLAADLRQRLLVLLAGRVGQAGGRLCG
jgi:MscS family membrane protein